MNLFNIPKTQTGYYVLAVLFAILVVFPINIPSKIATLVDTPLGKIIIAILVIKLIIALAVLANSSKSGDMARDTNRAVDCATLYI